MDDSDDADEEDIEAQIKRELEGLAPDKKKTRPVQAMQLDIPCGAFLQPWMTRILRITSENESQQTNLA